MTSTTTNPATARAVRFDGYGDIDVLHVENIPVPEAGADGVVVAVRAAGINPGEASIRKGLLHDMFPATFPSGQGSDFAGVVSAVGPDVAGVSVGDEVVGWTDARGSHATHVAVPAQHVLPKPAAVPFEVGGALFVAGMAALATVRALGAVEGRTVAVSGAAGGVGSIAVQLLVDRGAQVLGIASEANAGWLQSRGVEPVAHGDGLHERLRAAAPGGPDAWIDVFGSGYVDLAHELGLSVDDIVTIIDFDAVAAGRARSAGTGDASDRDSLLELLELVAAGRVRVEIARTYPLDQVQEAFRDLEQRRTRGKIVLLP